MYCGEYSVSEICRSLVIARKSLIFRGSPSFFMANVRRRDGLQNSYGAGTRKGSRCYKYHAPNGAEDQSRRTPLLPAWLAA